MDILDNNLHPCKISKLPTDYACNKIIHKCVHSLSTIWNSYIIL